MSEKIIVVGGGIIGAATAYYLAKKNLDVILLEGKDIAAGTSSSCDQAVLLQTKKPGPLLELALQSAQLYEGLEEELQKDIEYKKGGGMILFESEEHKRMMTDLVSKQQAVGLDVKIISAAEAHERQRGLRDHILGSTWSEHDAKVNSYKTTFAFADVAQQLGVNIKTNQKITGLLIESGKVIGVKTIDQVYYADIVVLATGVWTPPLLENQGIDVPIKPRRGQIIVTEKLSPIVSSNLLSAAYIAAKSGGAKKASKAQELGVGLVMGQTKSGNILIGGSREFVGFNTETTEEVITEIAKATVRVFPEFNKIKVIRTFAGLRPYTPDSLPIISPIEEVSGLYVNSGHEGDGIALAPISGKIMSEMIMGETSIINHEAFAMKRFDAKKELNR